MKKISISILILLICQLSVSAQFNKGTLYIDGSASLGNYKIYSDKGSNTSSGFNISPNIGLFVANRLAVGVGFGYLNYSYSNTTGTYTDQTSEIWFNAFNKNTNKLNEISPTLFAKYFYPFNDKLSLSLKASYAHGWGTNHIYKIKTNTDSNIEVTSSDDKIPIQSNYVRLSPELQFLITPKFGLQINFNGLSYESTNKYESQFYLFLNDYQQISTIKQNTTLLSINPKMWSFGVFFCL